MGRHPEVRTIKNLHDRSARQTVRYTSIIGGQMLDYHACESRTNKAGVSGRMHGCVRLRACMH
jgi:hypothetical protein